MPAFWDIMDRHNEYPDHNGQAQLSSQLSSVFELHRRLCEALPMSLR
jgi:hypothetical protein